MATAVAISSVVCCAAPDREQAMDPDAAGLHCVGGCGSGVAVAGTGAPHPSIHPWVGVGGCVDPWKRRFPWVDGRDEEGGRPEVGMGPRTGRRGRRWGWGSAAAAKIGEESGVGKRSSLRAASPGSTRESGHGLALVYGEGHRRLGRRRIEI